jgi:RNA polymerase sigma-70 factor (ECF subfamily)
LSYEESPVSRAERNSGGLAAVVPIGARRSAPPRYEDDASLVAALRLGDRAAMDVMVDRYGPLVERVLARILGYDGELADVAHDVFLTAFGRIRNLRHPELLKEWLRGVTVFVARECLRRRRRRRWLTFRPDDELPDLVSDLIPSTAADELTRLYRVLARMPPDECIVFTLRFMAEMELGEVATACGVSMTTVKRRQRKAERRFAVEARKDPVLRERIERGARWSGT